MVSSWPNLLSAPVILKSNNRELRTDLRAAINHATGAGRTAHRRDHDIGIEQTREMFIGATKDNAFIVVLYDRRAECLNAAVSLAEVWEPKAWRINPRPPTLVAPYRGPHRTMVGSTVPRVDQAGKGRPSFHRSDGEVAAVPAREVPSLLAGRRGMSEQGRL